MQSDALDMKSVADFYSGFCFFYVELLTVQIFQWQQIFRVPL